MIQQVNEISQTRVMIDILLLAWRTWRR